MALIRAPIPLGCLIWLLCALSFHIDSTKALLMQTERLVRHPSRQFTNFPLRATADPNDAFDLFCRLRIGIGIDEDDKRGVADPVYWAGSGTLYRAYSGEVLAQFAGVDVARGVWRDKHTRRQLSRKVFWFSDPKMPEKVLTEYQGQPVLPITYEAQVFDYEQDLENNQIVHPTVVSSAREVPMQPITMTNVDNDEQSTVLFQAPLFLDVPIPATAMSVNGDKSAAENRYQAWEFYDYTCDPSFKRPPTVSWTRQGSTAPFDTDQRAVMRFIGQRYESFDRLPAHIRERLNSDFPLYKMPPQNMEEVEELVKKRKSASSA